MLIRMPTYDFDMTFRKALSYHRGHAKPANPEQVKAWLRAVVAASVEQVRDGYAAAPPEAAP